MVADDGDNDDGDDNGGGNEYFNGGRGIAVGFSGGDWQ